jgi:hypothetical protein
LSMYITDTFLFFFTQEILDYRTHADYSYPVMLEDNPLAWWKQHGHLLPTLSRLARRYLTTPLRPDLLNVCFQSQGLSSWTVHGLSKISKKYFQILQPFLNMFMNSSWTCSKKRKIWIETPGFY